MDTFDALREQDAARREWVKAARIFTRLLDRVLDPPTIAWLERAWEQAIQAPLAPASEAWKLVDEAREQLALEAPLTPEEMLASRGELTTADVIRETRAWQEARACRDEQVEAETFSGS